jgi:hypothetical protein
MIFKYYTADLKVLNDEDLEMTSITIQTWFFVNPVQVVRMMKNQLSSWDQENHRIFNLRRIK